MAPFLKQFWVTQPLPSHAKNRRKPHTEFEFWGLGGFKKLSKSDPQKRVPKKILNKIGKVVKKVSRMYPKMLPKGLKGVQKWEPPKIYKVHCALASKQAIRSFLDQFWGPKSEVGFANFFALAQRGYSWPSWDRLVAILGHFRVILGPSWSISGLSWAIFGPRWGCFGTA